MTCRLKFIFFACAASAAAAAVSQKFYTQIDQVQPTITSEKKEISALEKEMNKFICRGKQDGDHKSYKKYNPQSFEQQVNNLKSEYSLFFSDLSEKAIIAELKKQNPDSFEYDEKSGEIQAIWQDSERRAHREGDLPALVIYNTKTKDFRLYYNAHGKNHRGGNKAAFIKYEANKDHFHRKWFLHDHPDRTDGGYTYEVVKLKSAIPISRVWARHPVGYKGSRFLHRSDGLNILRRDGESGLVTYQQWMQHDNHQDSNVRICEITHSPKTGSPPVLDETFNGQKVEKAKQKLCPSALKYRH